MGSQKGPALKRLAFFLSLVLPLLGVGADDDTALLAKLREKLKGKNDYIERNVERLGDKTLKVESFISMEGDLLWFGKIASDVQDYETWLLHKINERPDGGTYPVKVTALEKVKDDPYALISEMKIDFPLVKKTLRRKMRFVPTATPTKVIIDAEMPDLDDSMLSSGNCRLVFVKAEGEAGRMWGHLEGKVKIRNWFLYEALPTRILKREAGERFLQVVNNYLAEENRRIRSSQIPTGKRAAQGE